ncbi:MAG: hypothetical protein JNL82_13955 [Myxococcales bacterium]|nr:hypothetical protein [Myxococcales bacterium]
MICRGSSVLALSVCLSACGGGGSTPTTGESSDTGAGPTSADTGTATTAPTGDPDTTSDPPTSSVGATGTDTGEPTTAPVTSTDPATSDPVTSDPVTSDPVTGDTGTSSSGGDSTTGPSCGPCDQPNQQCIDDVCVTKCQGQDPDPCGPDQVCDVISGDCKGADEACVLDGPTVPCGNKTCGPGSVCDDQTECLPIAPCAGVVCTDEGDCWGDLCVCERAASCSDPSLELLNGPFSTEIGGIDFSDDCDAWMVTLRSGPDYLRRLKPDGTLTQWTGVANLNMGEVKVLRELTIPQITLPGFPWSNQPAPPSEVEGIGEVAITYTCCAMCGCQANPPQGVARLVEEDMVTPLPIVIVAMVTQGNGPFSGNLSTAANAGPQGLTWGVDRVLYVGNSTANGVFNSADLEAMTQEDEYMFPARVTASAPVSPVHLVVGLIGGEVHRFNAVTNTAALLVDLDADITSFSHDKFSGLVYAGLSNGKIVSFDPFTGDVADFGMMPGQGRVAVSPSGTLYYTPVKYLSNLPISSYDLPDSF